MFLNLLRLLYATDSMDALRHALDALSSAMVRYEHPEEEALVAQAAVGVQDAMNALLDVNSDRSRTSTGHRAVRGRAGQEASGVLGFALGPAGGMDQFDRNEVRADPAG